MVKHLEIANELGNIVIDENYSVPMLLLKGRVKCSTKVTFANPPAGYTFRYYYARSLAWSGYVRYMEGPIESFGDLFAGATTLAEIRAVVTNFNEGNIIAARCASGPYATIAFGGLGYDSITLTAFFILSASCELQNGEVDIVVYKSRNNKPSPFGMIIQDGDGKVLFDVMKPPMTFLGSMYGGINVWNNEAGRFDLTLPEGTNPEHCYITNMSGTPYYSAYNIHSGGVSWGETAFKSVMSFPSANLLRVQVLRVNAVAGTNSAFGYGGYFENVVYCPYPSGLYLEPAQL